MIKAVDKAIEYIMAKRKIRSENITKPISAETTSTEFIRTIDAQDYFFIKEKNTHIKLNMGEVLFIESMGDFSKITTTQQKTHFVLISLKNIEKQLPEKMFMRVHKQYIINLLHILHISASDIKLSSHVSIPLSAAYRQLLLDNIVAKKTLTRFSE